MAKTASINMRVNPEVKKGAEEIFSSLGMSIADAINIFLHKSIMEGGLPFDVRQPKYNGATEKAMDEARDILSGKIDAKRFSSTKDAFAFLDE